MKKYKIEIHTYPHKENTPEQIELTTDRIGWSMEQYQRNRLPFSWRILDVTG
jgi:hypothetical protein